MKKTLVIAAWLLACGVARAGGLDVRGWLDRPGTKLLVVEFYATWCEPCMKAVPKWKALHEKYRARGLRLVVVSTMDPERQCVNPGWQPDEMVCDAEGQIAEAFGLQGKLPAAFLWSWQGDLLVGKGHVDEVEKLVDQYLAQNPRVLVEVKEGQPNRRELRDLVREQLSSRGKLELVATESEARELMKLKLESFKARFDERLQCELGKEVPANSLLRVTVEAGKQPRLGLMLFSAESGCLLAAATVPWQAGEARRSVAEAVDKLLSRLRSDLQLPGAAERPAAHKAEDGKRKAQLWLEFAQSPFVSSDSEGQLKAYNQAIALDPGLVAAYLGRAHLLNFTEIGTPAECNEPGEARAAECLKKFNEKSKRIQDALSDIDKAISLDDNNAETYAQRVGMLLNLKENLSEIQMRQEAGNGGEDGGAEERAQVDRRILEDINRAIALGSVSKPYLYEQRSILNAQAGKPDKALADMTQAILCKEAEKPDVPSYYGQKDLEEYYLARANLHEGPDKKEQMEKDRQKGNELYEKRKRKLEEEQKELKSLLENSEIGKLRYELQIGWLERATGVSIKSMEGWNVTTPEPAQEKVLKKIKERIQRGQATAEEYLFMAGSYVELDAATKDRYLSEGIRLLKPQATDGKKALQLVEAYLRKVHADLYAEHFDVALMSLSDARAVIDQHHPRVLGELVDLMRSGPGDPPRELLVKLSKLSKEDAEAFFWWMNAIEVGHLRIQVYEKLGLASKAKDEYQYLCALKDEDACRNVERLK